MPGEGDPNADFMCVGEAPGANEDQTGRPFVGAAGQLLTKILAAIKLTREEVFIANVLKHRPPGNRNPAPDEVVACSPYLLRQLELVKPKVIVAFGTFAAQTLLETKIPLGKLREQVHLYHGTPLVVTYHPAALLRIGDLLEQGLNLAGVAKVLELEAANNKLHRALKRARSRPPG